MKREPVLFQLLVFEVLNLLLSFGLTLTVGQLVAINGVVAAALGLWVRARVTPLADPRLERPPVLEL